eukprot:TRINITY_DN5993_c0_g1_i1.p1 TRINITY_DN5993_c0_g1~~TRINITY_DN5993_c0_g1_i1.p1  ORF type:complete len:809 (+),score=136.87 TRINITY_DN5993_c0_g1_i1:131-2557(+)
MLGSARGHVSGVARFQSARERDQATMSAPLSRHYSAPSAEERQRRANLVAASQARRAAQKLGSSAASTPSLRSYSKRNASEVEALQSQSYGSAVDVDAEQESTAYGAMESEMGSVCGGADAIVAGPESIACSAGQRRAHVHEALFHLLARGGLRKTAACLHREANLPCDVADSDGPVARALAGVMDRRAATAETEQAVHKQHVEKINEDMATQRARMEKLHSVVKGLRGHLENASRGRHEVQVAAAARRNELRAAVAQRRMEIDRLRKLIDVRDTAKAALATQLAAAEENLNKLQRAAPSRGASKEQPSSPHEAATATTGSPFGLFDLLDKDGDGSITREELEEASKVMLAQVTKIRNYLANWDRPGSVARKTAEKCFSEVDVDGDGILQWNNSEVRRYAKEIFGCLGIAVPSWQDAVWYDIYRCCDSDNSMSLELPEALKFVRRCLEATLTSLLQSPLIANMAQEEQPLERHHRRPERAATTGGGDIRVAAEVLAAESWARKQGAVPWSRIVSYRNGAITVDLAEFTGPLQACMSLQPRHRPRIMRAIDSGDHIRSAIRIFRVSDRDRSGALTWNNGEIREFVGTCVKAYGLLPPREELTYRLYCCFDTDRSNSLSPQECAELVDVVLRALCLPDNLRKTANPDAVGHFDRVSEAMPFMALPAMGGGAYITRRADRLRTEPAMPTLPLTLPSSAGYSGSPLPSPSGTASMTTTASREMTHRSMSPGAPLAAATLQVSMPFAAPGSGGPILRTTSPVPLSEMAQVHFLGAPQGTQVLSGTAQSSPLRTPRALSARSMPGAAPAVATMG